ncbi:hypothetical protein KA005_82280 [bacterium]|nr:hypothetical protein [bacterium]
MISQNNKEATARYREFVENIEEPESPFKEAYGGMAHAVTILLRKFWQDLRLIYQEERNIQQERINLAVKNRMDH